MFLARIDDQQRHVQQVSDPHLATIEALALAIDAKDEIGQRHVRQMQVYAAGLANAMGMSETEIQGVKTASLLHDIGKLAVPEHILSKPGPLTMSLISSKLSSLVPFSCCALSGIRNSQSIHNS